MSKFKLYVTFILAVICSLIISTSVFAMDTLEATETVVLRLENGEPGIMPLWNYTNLVTLNLAFSGSTAVCELSVIGDSSSSGIKANMWLYQQNDNGSWTLLNSWKNITTTENVLGITRYYNPTYYGETYKLYFTGKCYAANGVYYDPLAAETIIAR